MLRLEQRLQSYAPPPPPHPDRVQRECDHRGPAPTHPPPELALSPNSSELHIYRLTCGQADFTFEREWVLSEHDAFISGLDWAPVTNRIVSCSHDRNAYVWQWTDGSWQPTLVILLINRAATAVVWTPDERKFAVGSGEKAVPVCYFEEANDWWVSKHIRKHQSTVLSVSWSPDSALLATGCADGKARVVSAVVKDVDSRPQTPGAAFGAVVAEFDCGAWVHAVTWHPNGRTLAFAAQDATVGVAHLDGGGASSMQLIRLRQLPLKALTFLPSGALVGAGYCYSPVVLSLHAGAYSDGVPLDAVASETSTAADAAVSGVHAARRMFQAQAKAAQESSVSVAARLPTVHQSTVMALRTFDRPGVGVEFTTAGLDGQVVFWTTEELSGALATLRK